MNDGDETFDGNGIPPAMKRTILVEKSSYAQDYGSRVSSEVLAPLTMIPTARRDSSGEGNDQVASNVSGDTEVVEKKVEQNNLQLDSAVETMVLAVDEIDKNLDLLTDYLDSKITELTTLSNGFSEYSDSLSKKVSEIKDLFSTFRTDSQLIQTLSQGEDLNSKKSEVVAAVNRVIHKADKLFGNNEELGGLRELEEFSSGKQSEMRAKLQNMNETTDEMDAKLRVYEDIYSQLISDVNKLRSTVEVRLHPTLTQILTAVG